MVDTIYDHIDVQTILQTASVEPTDFGLAMLLIDDPQIPADVRIRLTTKSAYSSEYTAGTTPYAFANVFWKQALNAQELAFGRWVSSAISAQFTCGTSNTTYTDYTSITDGEYTIAVEGINAGAATDITGNDFTGDASFDDVIATLNSTLHAADGGSYVDYDWALDSLGRLYVENPDDPGASSASVTLGTVTPTVGTDISGSGYLNITGGSANAGLDAETPVAAINEISAVNDDWYLLCERGCSDDEQVSVSTDLNGKRKTMALWVSDTDGKNPQVTTDVGYQVSALNHTRTYLIYSEQTSEYPDAAIVGRHIPATEGTVSWAWNTLSEVTASGNTASLSATDKSALKDKGYNYIESVQNNVSTPTGITADGNEMRHIIGRDWFNDYITVRIYNAQLNNTSLGFNTRTFGIIEGIIRAAGLEAVNRGFAVNTQERPFTINMPDPDDYDATTRATHELQLDDIFILYLDSAVYDIAITGTWTL